MILGYKRLEATALNSNIAAICHGLYLVIEVFQVFQKQTTCFYLTYLALVYLPCCEHFLWAYHVTPFQCGQYQRRLGNPMWLGQVRFGRVLSFNNDTVIVVVVRYNTQLFLQHYWSHYPFQKKIIKKKNRWLQKVYKSEVAPIVQIGNP